MHGCWSIRFEITLWHSEETIAQVIPTFISESKGKNWVNTAPALGVHTNTEIQTNTHKHWNTHKHTQTLKFSQTHTPIHTNTHWNSHKYTQTLEFTYTLEFPHTHTNTEIPTNTHSNSHNHKIFHTQQRARWSLSSLFPCSVPPLLSPLTRPCIVSLQYKFPPPEGFVGTRHGKHNSAPKEPGKGEVTCANPSPISRCWTVQPTVCQAGKKHFLLMAVAGKASSSNRYGFITA